MRKKAKNADQTAKSSEYIPRFATDLDAEMRKYPAMTPEFMIELREAYLASGMADGGTPKKQD